MLGAIGVSSKKADVKGAALASYLLFEAAYCRELMALGYADTQRKRAEVFTFFGWTDPQAPAEGLRAHNKPAVDRRKDPLRIP
jgi:NTE family protein